MLICVGYIYFLQKELVNDLKPWEYVMRRKGQCKAKVKLTIADEFVEEVNEHAHPHSETQVGVQKTIADVKRLNSTAGDTCQQVLGEKLPNVTRATAVNLPPTQNMKKSIPSKRQDRNRPLNPLKREHISMLLQQLPLIQNGENFLLHDSERVDEQQIFVFHTQQGINLLA